jgi:hypothetical protein
VLAGWKVEQDTSLGDARFSVAGKVKNISDATSSVDYLSADPACLVAATLSTSRSTKGRARRPMPTITPASSDSPMILSVLRFVI